MQTQEGCPCAENRTCTALASQYADVTVPISVRPYAVVGELVTECCGEPVIALRSGQGASGSGTCELVITQKICIKIPMTYGADADAGDLTTSCKRALGCTVGCGCPAR